MDLSLDSTDLEHSIVTESSMGQYSMRAAEMTPLIITVS